MKKFKYILIILICISLFIKNKVISYTDYNITLSNNDILVSFIMEKNINGLYIKDKEIKKLIILNYNNENEIEDNIKAYDIKNINKLYNIKPVILNLFNIDSEYLKLENNLITIKLNNNNFCIYNYEYQADIENKNCKFMYILKSNPNITENNFTYAEVIFQNYDNPLPTIIQEDIYNKWIDLYTINKEEYTLLKVSESNYDTIVIPRNSDNF